MLMSLVCYVSQGYYLAFVERTISTSGNQEYPSTTPSRYPAEGSGPKRPACICYHGPFGMSVICTSTGGFRFPVA